ncbi:response regulator [Flavobacterium sp.]|uniref:response regulator n=1 Tax=Flavobacterium sp. TaxID=239 RepID=UPI0028BF2D5D|nr:response regulator [Flavobacterium sp.]
MSKQSICIIDDDPIYQLVTKKVIEKSAFFPIVNSFSNGLEAINYIKENLILPEVILLDIEMPLMDGWDFLDEITRLRKELQNNSNIYIVSSSIAREDKEKAEAYDCIKGFISKPISLSIIEKIANED